MISSFGLYSAFLHVSIFLSLDSRHLYNFPMRESESWQAELQSWAISAAVCSWTSCKLEDVSLGSSALPSAFGSLFGGCPLVAFGLCCLPLNRQMFQESFCRLLLIFYLCRKPHGSHVSCTTTLTRYQRFVLPWSWNISATGRAPPRPWCWKDGCCGGVPPVNSMKFIG